MIMLGTKKVIFPIEVPDCDYCWKYTGEYPICDYFDNEGGHAECTLTSDFDLTERDDMGVIKPQKCANLKKVKT